MPIIRNLVTFTHLLPKIQHKQTFANQTMVHRERLAKFMTIIAKRMVCLLHEYPRYSSRYVNWIPCQ